MAIRRIMFSPLCILDDKNYVYREAGKWKLNEVATNQLYCKAANSGADSQRILPWGVWGPRPEGILSQFCPYEIKNGKFNLDYYNLYYFPILNQVVQIAKKYGIRTFIALADNCQFHGDTSKWSPWVTNIQGVTSIYDPKAFPFFKGWIELLTLYFKEDVSYPWGNEMNNTKWLDVAEKCIFPYVNNGLEPLDSTYGATMMKAEYVNGWYKDTNCVQDRLKTKVGMKFGDDVKLAIWKEVHGVGGAGVHTAPNPLDQALSWWGSPHNINIWFSDDGVGNGDSSCDIEVYEGKKRIRPSPNTWIFIIKEALKHKNDFIFEHLPNSWAWQCQEATLRAMYYALNNRWPEEKYHYDPPTPVPPTPIPPTPIPPQPPEVHPCEYFWNRHNYLHWLRCILLGKH